MKTTSKVRPGLSLSSHQIRSRLRNRTIQKQNPDNNSYIQDEELIKITRMNKVEREMAHRQTLKDIEETQKRLEKSSNAKKAKELDNKIEQLAKQRLDQMRKDEDSKKTQV